MNVSAVMSNYYSSSYLNSVNSDSSSFYSLLSDTNSELSTLSSLTGSTEESQSSALQDIYKTVQEDYGLNLTYDSHGNIVTGTSTSDEIPDISTFKNSLNASLISVFDSQNTTDTSSLTSLFNQYGLLQSNSSLYNTLYSNAQTTGTATVGSTLDLSV
jgi:hypothetical protein